MTSKKKLLAEIAQLNEQLDSMNLKLVAEQHRASTAEQNLSTLRRLVREMSNILIPTPVVPARTVSPIPDSAVLAKMFRTSDKIPS